MSKHRITDIETIVLDLPLIRTQRFAALGSKNTSIVLVKLRSDSGFIGFGECCTPSGPWWGGESVETIKLMIDNYLSPILIGADPFEMRKLSSRMDRQLFGNYFAKSGIDIALLDLQGKILELPTYDLLGGRQRVSLPCSWPLATGNPDAEIDEANEKIDKGQFNTFKLKMGFLDEVIDVERACKIARSLEGKASVRADPNESWDETTCKWAIPKMLDAGITLVEQPLPRWNLSGSTRVTQATRMAVMLDESACTVQDILKIGARRSTDLISLKLMKSGGLSRTRRIADTALEHGLSLYIGTFLECSLGTAAAMQLAATIADLPYGGELCGPCLIAEDITTEPAQYENFELQLNPGFGIAANINDEKVEAFRRDKSYTKHFLGTKKAGIN